MIKGEMLLGCLRNLGLISMPRFRYR